MRRRTIILWLDRLAFAETVILVPVTAGGATLWAIGLAMDRPGMSEMGVAMLVPAIAVVGILAFTLAISAGVRLGEWTICAVRRA